MGEDKRNQVLLELLLTEESYVDKLRTLNDTFVQPLLTKQWPLTKFPGVAVFLANAENLGIFHEKFLLDLLARIKHTKAALGESKSPTGSPIERTTSFREKRSRFEIKDDSVTKGSVYSDDESEAISKPKAVSLKRAKSLEILDSEIALKKGWVGDLFLSYSGLFKLYHPYARIYESVMPLFSECKDMPFLTFMKAAEDKAGETMASLAITPIQRIPRYMLLMKELLKNTPADHKDRENIAKAMEELDRAAGLVNEAIRSKTNLEELTELEKKFQGSVSLAQLGRKLVRTGTLTKVCRSTLKPFVFHLFNDLLLYSEETTMGLKVHRSLELKFVSIGSDIPEKFQSQHAFALTSYEKSFIVLCETDAERDAWVADISKNISENSGSDFRAAPVWVSSAESSNCQICKSPFNLIRQRHHCRNCGKLVCATCSKSKRTLLHADKIKEARVCDICVKEIDASDSKEASVSKEEIGTVDFDFSRKSGREDLVKELLRTETQFLKRLMLFLDVFASKHLQTLYSTQSSGFSGKLSRSTMKRANFLTPRVAVLFNNMEQMATLNAEFCKLLQARLSCWNEDSVIGNLFLLFAPLFKLYSQYARFFSSAMYHIQKDSFKELIEEAENDIRFIKCDLKVTQMLQLPLERIPTYERFLYEMTKKTPPVSKDTAYLQIALEEVRNCIVFVTEARELQLKINQVKELESKFATKVHLTTSTRELLMSGYLIKKNRKGESTKYMFHLFNDLLCYSTDSVLGLVLKKSLTLESLEVRDTETSLTDHSFLITTASKTFIACAENPSDKEAWVRALLVVAKRQNSRTTMVSSTPLSLSISVSVGSQSDSSFKEGGSTSTKSKVQSLQEIFSAPFSPRGRQTIKIETSTPGTFYEVDLIHSPLMEFQKSKICPVCSSELKILRKHHCQACGRMICSACCDKKLVLPHSPGMLKKVCDSCHKELDARKMIRTMTVNGKELPHVVLEERADDSISTGTDISETKDPTAAIPQDKDDDV